MPHSRRFFTSRATADLPRHFDSAEAERRWGESWEESGVYRYDPSRPRDE